MAKKKTKREKKKGFAYSSELYGEKVSNYLKIENRIVDIERKRFPISSTIVRKNYKENSKYIENFIYTELNKKTK